MTVDLRRAVEEFWAGRARGEYFPAGYFDIATERRLASFEKRARIERKLPLSVELPHLTLRPDIAAGEAATAMFANWLGYLSDGERAVSPRAKRGTTR